VGYSTVIDQGKPDEVQEYGIIKDLISQILNIIPKASHFSGDLVRECHRDSVRVILVDPDAAIHQDCPSLSGLQAIKERLVLESLAKLGVYTLIECQKDGKPSRVPTPNLQAINIVENEVNLFQQRNSNGANLVLVKATQGRHFLNISKDLMFQGPQDIPQLSQAGSDFVVALR
jgi:hypothetical protein